MPCPLYSRDFCLASRKDIKAFSELERPAITWIPFMSLIRGLCLIALPRDLEMSFMAELTSLSLAIKLLTSIRNGAGIPAASKELISEPNSGVILSRVWLVSSSCDILSSRRIALSSFFTRSTNSLVFRYSLSCNDEISSSQRML